jgi:hypothetical protein
MALVACAVLVAASGCANARGATYSLGTARFTTEPFSDAPEAIVQVVGVKRIGPDEILLLVRSAVCAKVHGSILSIRVTHVKDASFVVGEYGLIGAIRYQGQDVSALRHLSSAERERMCAIH